MSVFPANTTVADVEAHVRKMTARCEGHLGGWFDDRGRLWLEYVDLRFSAQGARELAQERGELAFFDLYSGRSIAVPPRK
jgi:hypothetical protein